MPHHNIVFTEDAADQVKSLLQDAEPDMKLRVYVSGGGCSGFQYGFKFDDTTQEDDTILNQHGVKILVDSMSIGYLGGSTIDYITSLMGSQFSIKNPSATATCGCGSSFDV